MNTFKEEMAFSLYGRSLSLSQAGCQCVKCGSHAVDFTDELSRKEYGISGFCQGCQDDFFGSPDSLLEN